VDHVHELDADDRHDIVGGLGQFLEPGFIEAGIVDDLAHVLAFHALVDVAQGGHDQEGARLDPFALDQRIGRWIARCARVAIGHDIGAAHDLLDGVDGLDRGDPGKVSPSHAVKASRLAGCGP
jgi:hypothetical protein